MLGQGRTASQEQRRQGQQGEEGGGRGERSAGAEPAGEIAAHRGPERYSEDERAAHEAHGAAPPGGFRGVQDQGHHQRPAHHREGPLEEAQQEQQVDTLEHPVGRVEGRRAEEADHDEGPAGAEAVAQQAPERREEDVGEGLDREEEGGVRHRAAQLVDHELLEAGHHQGEVEHGPEEERTGEQDVAPQPCRAAVLGSHAQPPRGSPAAIR